MNGFDGQLCRNLELQLTRTQCLTNDRREPAS